MTNPVSIGRIRHKDQTYPGLHPAFIDGALWRTVQTKPVEAGARPRGRSGAVTDRRILTGKLRERTGDPLTPRPTPGAMAYALPVACPTA